MADRMYVNCYAKADIATQVKTICEKQYPKYTFEITLDKASNGWYNLFVESTNPLYSLEFSKVWAYVDGVEAGMNLANKMRNKQENALTS